MHSLHIIMTLKFWFSGNPRLCLTQGRNRCWHGSGKNWPHRLRPRLFILSTFQLQPVQPQCLQTWRKAWVKFYSSWVSSRKFDVIFLLLYHSSTRRITKTRDVFRYIAAKASKARHKRSKRRESMIEDITFPGTTSAVTVTNFGIWSRSCKVPAISFWTCLESTPVDKKQQDVWQNQFDLLKFRMRSRSWFLPTCNISQYLSSQFTSWDR